jgi:RHS repeat-associated protein
MCNLLAKTWKKSQPAPDFGVFLCKKSAHRETFAIFELSRKELDQETGFYYYGARYLNPRTSMWISADPAMGDYIPSAPASDEARKRNENLPGMGGVFNYVNFHVYHYSANNPVKYIDPDGRNPLPSHVTNQPAYQNMVTRQAEMDTLVEGFGLAAEHLETNNALGEIIDRIFFEGKLEDVAIRFYFTVHLTVRQTMKEFKNSGFFDFNDDGKYSSNEVTAFTNAVNNTLLLNFSDQHTLGPYRVKLPVISEAKAAEYLNSPSKTSALPYLERQIKE